jgi:5-carboxymethyl-2-hydroxymuconate isomerase
MSREHCESHRRLIQSEQLILQDVRSQAAKLEMTIQAIEFKGSAMLDATLEAAAGRDALLVVADSTLLDLGERIAGLALRHRLPTFSSIPEFTDAACWLGTAPPDATATDVPRLT